MDEIETLLKLINGLPNLALWVLAVFYAYKVVIVGSIYGVIRFLADRLFQYGVHKKAKTVDFSLYDAVQGLTINTDVTKNELIQQIRRIGGKGINIESRFIHLDSVKWLREAIDAKEKEDELKLIENKPKTLPFNNKNESK